MAEKYPGSMDTSENYILDEEISRLAYQIIPDEVRRFSMQYLRIPDLDYKHAKAESQAKSWDVAFKCIDIWRKRYCGPSMRSDLYEVFHGASQEGLISLEEIQFLKKSSPARYMELQIHQPINTEKSQRSLVSTNQGDEPPLVVLNQIANELCSHSMETVAVDIFGFSKKQLKSQKRLAEQQVMFAYICSWWQFQQGPDSLRAKNLLKKLESTQEIGLISKSTLNKFQSMLSETFVDCDTDNKNVDPFQKECEIEILTDASVSDEETSFGDVRKGKAEGQPNLLRKTLSTILNILQTVLCFWRNMKMNAPFRQEYTKVPDDEAEEMYTFDVFISYAHEDEQWLAEGLLPHLEGECGFQTCIHARDFVAGRTIFANMLDAVSSSRKALLIISDNFLRSHWCLEELRIIHSQELMRNDPEYLILAVLPNTDIRTAPEPLYRFLCSHTYISVENQWALRRISNALGKPQVKNPKITEL